MRIVLNVSTSIDWTRPPVGVVRTEQKFARFLLERSDLEVAFCRFDRPSRRYVEVSPRALLARLDGATADELTARTTRGTGEVSRPPGLRPRGRQWIAALARRCLDRLPDAIRADATIVARSADQLLRGTYWLARSTVRAALPGRGPRRPAGTVRHMTSAVSGPPPFRFTPADCYVSIGFDWDRSDTRVLWDAKRTVGFKTLLYCHDLIPVYLPHFMSYDARHFFAAYFVDVAHCADHVVAVSRTTRDDYLRFLEEVGAPVPPVSVVPPGTEIADGAPREDVATRYPELAREPFVLCVGTIEVRKNHELLYRLWERLTARHGERTPRLVLVGMVGWGVNDLLMRLRSNPQVAEKITILDQVDDGDLSWLYRQCRFSIFPSLYEGWGLPVVESLALGKPCIVSDAPAVLEASQGLVPALDPFDFAVWLAQIERWLFESDALAEAETRVRRGYVPRPWHRHGSELLQLIHGLEGGERCASSI